jgi:hypothetical protein
MQWRGNICVATGMISAIGSGSAKPSLSPADACNPAQACVGFPPDNAAKFNSVGAVVRVQVVAQA